MIYSTFVRFYLFDPISLSLYSHVQNTNNLLLITLSHSLLYTLSLNSFLSLSLFLPVAITEEAFPSFFLSPLIRCIIYYYQLKH